LVSVMIPTYNYARFLPDAVDAALAQTYPNIEVVVSDNASTDGTAELVAERYGAEPRVRYVRNDTNIGLVPNFNRALALARGEFVQWVSADDWILPDHIARLMSVFDQHPQLDVVYTRNYAADASGRAYAVKGDETLYPVDYVDARDELPPMLYGVCQVCLPTALFRRALFDELGPMDEAIAIAADWELAVRLALARKRFAYVSEPTACIRAHGANASGRDWRSSGGAASELLAILTKYLDHPEMHRIRGYELRIVGFLDFLCQQVLPESAAAEAIASAAPVRNELLRRFTNYEPARVREHRVSVAIPMTMRPQALMRAVDAVAAQTHANWEIVVVEQGIVPVRPLLRAHPASERIACVRLPAQRTAGAARNLAVGLVRGEYLTFLDEDNTVSPAHLETLVGTLERTGADVAVASARLIVERADPQGITFEPLAAVEGIFRHPDDRPELGAVANALPLNAVLHHRRFFQLAGGFNDEVLILEDFDYLMRLQSTARFAFTGETTLDVHVRLRLAAQALGAYAERYLPTLDALYASRAVEPEIAALRAAHRAAVAHVLGARTQMVESAQGAIELMHALAGRAVM
jgi:glycosyltransferase involved in cell wall biosynthesis